jgi:hypothetical protein
LRRSFSVIGISLTGEQRRAFCAFAKIRAQFTRRGRLLRPRVRDPQQHVGVSRLVERAPAGEIFVLPPVRLGPKRTPRFVIFLSLAVFDRVKTEGLAASAEPDA